MNTLKQFASWLVFDSGGDQGVASETLRVLACYTQGEAHSETMRLLDLVPESVSGPDVFREAASIAFSLAALDCEEKRA